MTRLALLSDVHMRDEHATRLQAGLVRIVDRLAAFDPDHTFVLGDLVEDGASGAADRESVRRVRSALDAAPFPVTYLLGNHDVVNLDRAAFADLLAQESFHGVVDVDGTPVVYLDSAWRRGGPRGELGADQRAWLRDRLGELSGALVLVHHPLGAFDLSENPWFADYPERAFLGDRKEVLDLIEEVGGVRATVSGHVHQTGLARFRGLAHVSLNAFSKEAPDVPFTGTFAEITVDGDLGVDVKTPEGTAASYTLE